MVKPRPKRSIVFLCVTAEEQGLLGAKYYADPSPLSLERTLADVNLDVINLWGPTTDLISIGMGNSTLDDLLVEIARMRGRTVTPDADPEKGYYFRSDHFEFAKQGVPALDPKGGREYVGKSADFGKRKQAEYTAKDYHKPSDQVKPDWDLIGAAADLGIFLELGYRVAEGDRFPEWKPRASSRPARGDAQIVQAMNRDSLSTAAPADRPAGVKR